MMHFTSRLLLILKITLSVLAVSILLGQSNMHNITIISFPEIPQKYSDLTKKVRETSGLIYYDNNIWTFNDSQGRPEIYRIDSQTGNIEQTIILKNASNTDWEDIAHDEAYIYIGDFGNNRGNRKDLRIYKISKSLIGGGKQVEIPSEVIAFSYNDQSNFVINNRSNNYDCESLISFGDSLIIFTKNWIDGLTRMYKMPKIAGLYALDPIGVFDIKGLATGADYSIEHNDLIMIGYQDYQPFIVYFQDFNGHQLGAGPVYKIKLNKLAGAQTEGICWINEELIAFSTEQTSVFLQSIFQLNPSSVVKHLD
jgi:hypothetical protein